MTTRENFLDKLDTIGMYANRLEAAAHEDLEDVIQYLACVRDTADSALRNAVDDARRQGLSWDTIGRRLGVTRQAAQQRYGG